MVQRMVLGWLCTGCLAATLMLSCSEDEAGTAEICTLASDCSDSGALCLDGVCASQCESEADCSFNQSCQAGICRATTVNCSITADCPFPQQCVAGVCELVETPSCSSSAECASGTHCEGGRCVSDCVRNSDCAEGQLCVSGQCEAECVENRDCAASEVCQAGQCVAESSGGCTGAGDCSSGEDCVNGVCTPQSTGCTQSSECGSGERCEGGQCVPDTPTPECTQSFECEIGEACVNNRCVPENSTGCTQSSECGSGEQCVEGQCVPESTSGCQSDGACATGQICQGRTCVEGCRSAGDCSSGEICESNRCVEDTPVYDYSGTFSLTSPSFSAMCGQLFELGWPGDDVIVASQSGTQYTWRTNGGAGDTWSGTIDAAGTFAVPAPTTTGRTQSCGDFTATSIYQGDFPSGPDFFTGTLAVTLTFSVDQTCNCTANFPLNGQRQ